MGTNASYFIPVEVAKHHNVMIVEGPSYEAEADLIVSDHQGLNVQTVNETDFEKRLMGLCKYIDQFQPDIIHIYYHHQALRLGKALRKKYSKKIKLLLDIRTPLLEERYKQRLRVQFRAMLLQSAFDMIATHSPYSVKTIFPLCWLPVRQLSYGVDIGAFTPRTSPWSNKNIDLVYTGAIAKKRKIEQLLLGFKNLLQQPQAQDFNFKLHLYGAGNRFNEMQILAEQLKLKDKVIFHGVVKQTELSKNLKTHAIGIGYVPYGIYKQAPALKTIEYICAGLNVLASNTQPTKDLVSQGFSLKTYDNTPNGFANGVLEICANGWDSDTSQNNLKLMETFDWKHIVHNTLLPMYKELAGT